MERTNFSNIKLLVFLKGLQGFRFILKGVLNRRDGNRGFHNLLYHIGSLGIHSKWEIMEWIQCCTEYHRLRNNERSCPIHICSRIQLGRVVQPNWGLRRVLF